METSQPLPHTSRTGCRDRPILPNFQSVNVSSDVCFQVAASSITLLDSSSIFVEKTSIRQQRHDDLKVAQRGDAETQPGLFLDS